MWLSVFSYLYPPKELYFFIHFFPTVYLIRLNIENYHEISIFSQKLTFIRTRYRQNQHLWCQNGDKMSPGNQGVFQLLKEVTFRRNLMFYNALKWGCLGSALYAICALLFLLFFASCSLSFHKITLIMFVYHLNHYLYLFYFSIINPSESNTPGVA